MGRGGEGETQRATNSTIDEPTSLAGSRSSPGPWSIKRLIRRIVLSRAYQLSSSVGDSAPSPLDPRPSAPPVDPDNRLLARQNRRRLDAESLRDTMLVVSGRLDRKVGGPNMVIGAGGEYGYQFTDVRRSVYTAALRNRTHELFEVFDVADPNLVTGRRNVSTVATQALYLLNSPFVMTEAEHAAKRFLAEAHPDDAARFDRVCRLALSRPPTENERAAALAFVSSQSDAASRQAAWSRVIQSLFASIDFRYAR